MDQPWFSSLGLLDISGSLVADKDPIDACVDTMPLESWIVDKDSFEFNQPLCL